MDSLYNFLLKDLEKRAGWSGLLGVLLYVGRKPTHQASAWNAFTSHAMWVKKNRYGKAQAWRRKKTHTTLDRKSNTLSTDCCPWPITFSRPTMEWPDFPSMAKPKLICGALRL